MLRPVSRAFTERVLPVALICLGVVAAAPPANANFDWLGKIEVTADDLQAKDSKTRLQAVQQLAKFDIRWSKEHLLRALRDPAPEVRRKAGRLLGSHDVKAAAPIVIGWLTEPDTASRTAAAEILGQLESKKAVPALIRALGDPDDQVRVRAVAALGHIGAEPAVIPLIGRLEDEKAAVRLAAVKALVELGDSRAVVQLVGSFDDSSIEIRNQAIRAVGKLGDQAAVPPLLRLLRDRVVRSAAATALGDLASVRAIDPLIQALKTERSDNSYRALAATALGRIAAKAKSGPNARRSVEALVTALADSHMRKAAREALRIAGPVAVPALIDHLQGKLPGDPGTAVLLLRDFADPRATEALVEELERSRLDRGLVLSALSKSGDERALVPILALLRDPDPEVRLAAMRSLEPMVERDSRAADVVVELLDDKVEDIQVLAARYLGEMRAKVAIEPLMALVSDADSPRRLRAQALHALGEIGDPRGSRVALAILESRRDELHRAAATALVHMAPAGARQRLLALATGWRKQGDERRRVSALARLPALRALTAVVRDRPHATTRKKLVKLAKSGPTLTSQAAIEALGAMADPKSRAALRSLAEHPDPTRRAAAIRALARVDRDVSSFLPGLRSRDDRVAGAAARALAAVGGIDDHVDVLLAIVKRAGIAAQVNASAALARHLPAGRAPVARSLIHHRNPVVRANAIFALGRLKSAGARDVLETALAEDNSWLVRVAAARALSRIGGAQVALGVAAKDDGNPLVREEAARALEVAFNPSPPKEWRNFLFIDPTTGGSPVANHPYVVIGSDGVGMAIYSDARGEAVVEHFPPGRQWVKPMDRLSEL